MAAPRSSATAAFLPTLPQRRFTSSSSSPSTRLAAGAPFDQHQLSAALIDAASPPGSAAASFLALAPEAQMVFEPKLDGGALTSLVVIAAVVLVFWLRVWVAVSDRLKRENLEKLSKEMRLKRLSGTFKDDDADTLRRAEEEQATPVLGPLGTWLRGFRLVTRNSREENQDGEQQ